MWKVGWIVHYLHTDTTSSYSLCLSSHLMQISLTLRTNELFSTLPPKKSWIPWVTHEAAGSNIKLRGCICSLLCLLLFSSLHRPPWSCQRELPSCMSLPLRGTCLFNTWMADWRSVFAIRTVRHYSGVQKINISLFFPSPNVSAVGETRRMCACVRFYFHACIYCSNITFPSMQRGSAPNKTNIQSNSMNEVLLKSFIPGIYYRLQKPYPHHAALAQ